MVSDSVKLKDDDILFKDLSFEIVGAAFSVYNELGPGHLEKTYEKALMKELTNRGIRYKTQVLVPVIYSGEVVGNNRLDLVVENKIIVELKTGSYFDLSNKKQVNKYLAVTKLELAILLNFTKDGVRQKRIVNLK